MPYDSENCPNCPYFKQKHLSSERQTSRDDPPVELECHNSKILIVAEAPGIEEWREGAPLQPTIKQGGTAGARIAKSWERTNNLRDGFDLVNVVQCYPGVKNDQRDARPHQLAVCSCSGRLAVILQEKEYDRVICFGDAATKVITHLRKVFNLTFDVDVRRHPTGGVKNADLDSVW